MQNKYILAGTLILIGAIASMVFKPATAAAAGSLTVGEETIPLGGSIEIIQELDQKGEVKKFLVIEPDGDECEADGGSVSPGNPLVRVYPNDFTIDEEVGDGECNTNNTGTYQVETLVKLKDGQQSSNQWSFSNKNYNNDDDDCRDYDNNDKDWNKYGNNKNSKLNSNNYYDNYNDDDDCENENDCDDDKDYKSYSNNSYNKNSYSNWNNNHSNDDKCEDDDCDDKDDDKHKYGHSAYKYFGKYFGKYFDNHHGYDGKDDDKEDECVVKHKVEFNTTFFVLPESPVGALALVGSSLGALGGFYFVNKRGKGNYLA
jgi:hypothetical protein